MWNIVKRISNSFIYKFSIFLIHTFVMYKIYYINKIWFYVFASFFVIYYIFTYLYYVYKLKYSFLFEETLNYTRSFPYLTAISGQIRAGKTTLMYGLSNLLVQKNLETIYSKLDKIESILIKVNFEELIKLYLKIDEDDLDLKFEKLLDGLKVNDNYIYDLNGYYFNGIDKYLKIDMLKKYFELFNELQRESFVMSKTKTWNQITGSYSLKFSPDYLKIKRNNQFPFRKWTIILDDEKSLDSSNVKNYGKAEDDGGDVFLRLFGNMFQETCYYLTTLQNANRYVKVEREIIQQHIYVNSFAIVGDFRLFQRFLKFMINFCNKRINKIRDFEKRNTFNFWKKLKIKCSTKIDKLISQSFIRFDCKVTDNLDELHKPECSTFDFVVPLVYCWGIGDTHAFTSWYEYLKKRSTLVYEDLPESSDDESFEIEKILEENNSSF